MAVTCGRKTCSKVSVPFSMGTVLHHGSDNALTRDNSEVSVPFSMGTVLHHSVLSAIRGVSIVSVPFSMGTVLHRIAATGRNSA